MVLHDRGWVRMNRHGDAIATLVSPYFGWTRLRSPWRRRTPRRRGDYGRGGTGGEDAVAATAMEAAATAASRVRGIGTEKERQS